MSRYSFRIERRLEEFNIRDNTDIDPAATTMTTLDQDKIKSLVVDFQQAAAAAALSAPRNAAPAPAPISEKFAKYHFKTGINTGTSDGKKLYK